MASNMPPNALVGPMVLHAPSQGTPQNNTPKNKRSRPHSAINEGSNEPRRKRTKSSHGPDIRGEIVSITTSGNKTLQVHKALLVKDSLFAKARFSTQWQSSGDPNVLSLTNIRARDMEIFVQWLYTDKIHAQIKQDATGMALLVDLYLTSEYLQSNRFCNTVMYELCDLVDHGDPPYPDMAQGVYSKTSDGSSLRKLVVDQHVYKGGGEYIWAEKRLRDPHRGDFLADVVAEMVNWKFSGFGPNRSPKFAGKWVDRYLLKE